MSFNASSLCNRHINRSEIVAALQDLFNCINTTPARKINLTVSFLNRLNRAVNSKFCMLQVPMHYFDQ